MPWESRFKSERARRATIGLVMLVLLLVSTALAVVFTESRKPSIPLGSPRTLGAFAINLPDKWQPTEASENTDDRRRLGVFSGGETGPYLEVWQIDFDRPRQFTEALEVVSEECCPTARWIRSWSLQVDAMDGVFFFGMERAVTRDRNAVFIEHLLSVLTLDARTHLVLYLSRVSIKGQPTSEDADNLLAILDTVRDIRYETIEQDVISIDQLSLPKPSGLSAFRRIDSTPGHVLLLPAQNQRRNNSAGFRIRLRELPWEQLVEASGQADDGTGEVEAAPSDSQVIAGRIASLLAGAYTAYNDQAPPEGAIGRQVIDDRVVHAVGLTETTRDTLGQWLWVIQLEDGRMAMMDIAVEPGRVRTAQAAASAVAMNLRVPAPDERPKP